MRNLILGVLSLLTITASFSQNLQNANWCFGANAGVNFNNTPPTPFISALGTGPAGFDGVSVSDDNGQLLFYTNGINVWNRNDTLMPNGNNLYGWTNEPIAQKTIIIPKPNNPGIYYIFTLSTRDRYWIDQDNPQGRGGLHYSVVNMNLQLGLGDVDPNLKNIQVNSHYTGIPLEYDLNTFAGLYINQSTKMTTTLHNDGDKIWLCVFPEFEESNTTTRFFYSYLITSTGIDDQQDGSVPSPAQWRFLNFNSGIGVRQFAEGTIKISPNGQRLCEADADVRWFSFDNQIGDIPTPPTIIYTHPPSNTSWAGYGMEFSPNSNLIYFSVNPLNYIIQTNRPEPVNKEKEYFILNQYDIITNNKIEVIKTEILKGKSSQATANLPSDYPFGLQLAMDNKIYACALGNYGGEELVRWLGVINNPDVSGVGCNYNMLGLPLVWNTFHSTKLPQWIHKVKKPWPKIYEAAESNGFKIDQSGNIFSAMGVTNMANNINHSGVIANTAGTYWVHYNKITGITNWISSDWRIGYPISSGDINFIDYPQNNIYRNGSTGVLTNGPSNVPVNQIILAEETGGFLTVNGYNLNSYNPSGLLVSSIPIASIPGYFLANFETGPAIYNPATNNLYISHTYFSGWLGYIYRIGIYHFDPFTHALLSVNSPGNNQVHGPVAQVNTAGKVFIYNPASQMLEEYDWQTNQYTPLSIGNFSNNSLEEVTRSNHLVEDRIIIKNTNLHYFYCINTGTSPYTSTKITYNPPNPATYSEFDSYAFDGNTVFIAGQYIGTGFSIGNQSIPLLGSSSAFITQFDLMGDFNRPFQQEYLTKTYKISERIGTELKEKSYKKIQIFPNPATTEIRVIGLDGTPASISFSDIQGRIVLQQRVTNSYNIQFSVKNLTPGLYNCTIKTEKGLITKKIIVLKR